MIGTRRSYQSNGSMTVDPRHVMDHQYYRKSMDSSLLPYVKSIINLLQQEALCANYVSGESLMSLYKKILCLRDEKILCKQTILTQNHFYNTIHKDNGSVLDNDYTQSIMNLDFISHPERKKYGHTLIRYMRKTWVVYQKVQHVAGLYVKLAQNI